MKQPARWSVERAEHGNDFAAIGLPDPQEDLEFFNRFFAEYQDSGYSIPAADGRYVLWQLPLGTELCVTLDADDRVR